MKFTKSDFPIVKPNGDVFKTVSGIADENRFFGFFKDHDVDTGYKGKHYLLVHIPTGMKARVYTKTQAAMKLAIAEIYEAELDLDFEGKSPEEIARGDVNSTEFHKFADLSMTLTEKYKDQ